MKQPADDMLGDKLDRFLHKQSVICKFCRSPYIVRYGTFQGMQRYFCKNCHRKFADNDALPKMKTPVWIISLALNCYYDGMSLGAIQREINHRHGAYYAQSGIYNWIIRFSEEAVRQAKSFQPEIGDKWLLIITPVNTGHRRLWFMDIFDMNSRFLLFSHLSELGTVREAMDLFNSTELKNKKTFPRPVTIILLGSFVRDEVPEKVSGSEFSDNFIITEAEGNSGEHFEDLLKKRNNVVHSFKILTRAQTMTDAWRLHYNFCAGNDTTAYVRSAQKIYKLPFKNWRDVISQSSVK